MNKISILLFFFLISCTPKTTKNSFNFFDETISYEDFKLKLIKYSNENPFPNIND